MWFLFYYFCVINAIKISEIPNPMKDNPYKCGRIKPSKICDMEGYLLSETKDNFDEYVDQFAKEVIYNNTITIASLWIDKMDLNYQEKADQGVERYAKEIRNQWQIDCLLLVSMEGRIEVAVSCHKKLNYHLGKMRLAYVQIALLMNIKQYKDNDMALNASISKLGGYFIHDRDNAIMNDYVLPITLLIVVIMLGCMSISSTL